ncbi:MAG TPA: 2-oxoacid:acceptor oxidoreductase subunit alpha [Candidatus Dojkabacteria bacterium]|nr:2-oxoacid:acceptor oxidoreductase subunit alpha [Candidatus Dojkabacteria bacterium]HRP51212.1 2-oxoacid:acceptor oxidoreductase subunit alpha [Candidatus Dojkabacteria bacterium]
MNQIDIKRFSIKFGGESGQGINSLGEILAKALKNSGYKIFGYREYPSLIRGGYASYQIDVANDSINSSSQFCDILVCSSRRSIYQYLRDLRPNGLLIHTLTAVSFKTEDQEFISQNNIQVKYVDALTLAKQQGGNALMSNMILLGALSEIIGLDLAAVEHIVSEQFADKPKLLEIDLKCLKVGHELNIADYPLTFIKHEGWHESKIITGNHAIALGAISAGARAYYSYPMTPASSILTYLAETSHESGMLVKQAEDEITAAQMALGSMHIGTRAFTGTSGGGFDLMTETISLAGIIETPLVLVLAQRPGPATGLPTWTSAGDLNLALHAGHGEFPRIVLSASDFESAYSLIQNAFDLAEKFQTPVILLTEKQIAEGLYNIKDLPRDLEINRYLISEADVTDKTNLKRYQFKENGISPRWLPGSDLPQYNANGDEHDEIGDVNEEALNAKLIAEKRMKKMNLITQSLPEPTLYGDNDADITFIGWGSVKPVVYDVRNLLSQNNNDLKINYLHYDYLFPLKTERLLEILKTTKRPVLIENNYLGQLGNLITSETGFKFNEKLLKYDGRPFFIEDILNFINS